MIASQYVFTAAAFNFGFTYRQHWIKNYLLVVLVVGFMFIHYWITLVPGPLSCWLRINCSNEYNLSKSVYVMGRVAIQNPYNTTLMPLNFRIFLAVLMTVNLLAVLGWEYFIVGQGYGKRLWLWLVGMCWQEPERDDEKPILRSGETRSQDSKYDDL